MDELALTDNCDDAFNVMLKLNAMESLPGIAILPWPDSPLGSRNLSPMMAVYSDRPSNPPLPSADTPQRQAVKFYRQSSF